MLEIFKEFRFEAAHWLPHVPEGHPCGRLHGHSYRVRIHVKGDPQLPQGWVMDFADIKRAVEPVIKQLDHTCLNDVDGLENPTSENLAMWLYARLHKKLRDLSAVGVSETENSGCVFRPTP
jgi:6-pyruvoyltetrahydropterin/6-carboxytetrahydropterin synthase